MLLVTIQKWSLKKLMAGDLIILSLSVDANFENIVVRLYSAVIERSIWNGKTVRTIEDIKD